MKDEVSINKKKRKEYARNNRTYTHPVTGETGDTKYWGQRLGMRSDSFWRRVSTWGEDDPKTFEPNHWKNGKNKSCNKNNSDIVWRTTSTVKKEIAEKIEEAIKNEKFAYITDLVRAAVDDFKIEEKHKKLVYHPVLTGKKNKTREGKSLILKFNQAQKDKLDELIKNRRAWLEYSERERPINLAEALELVLSEFFEPREKKEEI